MDDCVSGTLIYGNVFHKVQRAVFLGMANQALASDPVGELALADEPTAWETFNLVMGTRWEHAVAIAGRRPSPRAPPHRPLCSTRGANAPLRKSPPRLPRH